jgi:D-3-phosphoglycerate dehydrogenase
MSRWDHLKKMKVVRLNSESSPVGSFEQSMYRQYGITPTQLEENNPEELARQLHDADAILAVGVSLPETVIDSLSKCQIISRLGNGTDKIAVERATSRGIVITNVPYFCVTEMADHAMGMILALHRRFANAQRLLIEGDFSAARADSLLIRRLSTQTLGIVGFGATGQELARRAKACGMRVIAFRRRMSMTQEAEELGVEMADFETVLTESDYLSLNTPLTKETYNLLDEAALRRMKKGACLINTARGAIVDQRALARVLEDGHLAGAGVDTFSDFDPLTEKRQPPDHPLLHQDNVILTPHVSGLSVEAQLDVTRVGVENVATVLSGHLPRPDHIVNPKVQPRSELMPFRPDLLDNSGGTSAPE